MQHEWWGGHLSESWKVDHLSAEASERLSRVAENGILSSLRLHPPCMVHAAHIHINVSLLQRFHILDTLHST